MSAKNLLKVLGDLGGGTLAGQIAKGVGGPILSGIAERYGLNQDDEDFSETAADRLLADKESNQFIKDMEAMHLEKFKVKTADTQDARKHYYANPEDDTPKKIIDRTYMMLGACVTVQLVIIIISAVVTKAVTVEAAAASNTVSMIIGSLLKQMGSQSDFYFGSSIGSKTSGAANEKVMQTLLDDGREDDRQERSEKARIVETVSTTRPIHNPVQAAPQPAAPATPAPEMDEIDAAMAETVSTTRPGSEQDNIL